MRVLHTTVARTTAETITVEFKGEGNDLVTVRMSAEPDIADDAAVLRAREMMMAAGAAGDARGWQTAPIPGPTGRDGEDPATSD